MQEQRWDDERANHLLDAARVVLEAAGGWQTPEEDHADDPASLLWFAELYFSEGVRRGIWPHVDLMNRGITAGNLDELRLGVSGGRTATDVLLRKGHRRVGFINLGPGIPAAVGRLEGYKQALDVHGLAFDSSLLRYGDGTADGGYRCATELMRVSDRPTAIFCGNDPTAMGTYEALKERDLRIPEDIAVVGFDNQELIAAHLRPALSTVALPHHEMGRWAVEYLIDRIARGKMSPTRHAISCPYVERESV